MDTILNTVTTEGHRLAARLALLKTWLKDSLGIQQFDIAPASADASFRRYFRVQYQQNSVIVMDAPPEKEDCTPFIKVSALLHDIGLHVPVVMEKDLQQGFLLLSDLGQRTYLAGLTNETVDSMYGDAMQALLQLQQAGLADLPDYDEALLLREMNLFRDWYLVRHLGMELSEDEHALLDNAFAFLAQSALQQPKVIVHRDYHSRNLMLCEPNPGILDFQDAVLGPVSYDLVSLLRDCYIAWPRQRVESWVVEYYRQALEKKILQGVDEKRFLRWFDLMGIQRHLKASGIFARLNHRDGKPGYLDDIPRTLEYIEEVAKDYPELADFCRLLARVQSGTRQSQQGKG